MLAFSTLAITACGGGAGTTTPPAGVAPSSIVSIAGNTVTITGTIVQMIPSGFQIQAGQGAGINDVFIGSATSISGPAPFVGEQVEVTGNGSLSTSINATSISQIGGTTAGAPPPATATPVPAGTLSVAGPVTGTITGGFTINAGPGIGFTHVLTNASTAFTDGSVQVGKYAVITGKGTIGVSVTALAVAQFAAAPSATSLSGTVTAITSYGFTLKTASSVPVLLTSATQLSGSALATGSNVNVSGTGSASAGILAAKVAVASTPVAPPTSTPQPVNTPTPQPPVPAPNPTPPQSTPAPTAMHHVLTGDYLGGYFGTKSIAWSQAAPYLTWAQTNANDANAIAAAGMKTQDYIDPNRLQGPGDPMWGYSGNTESDFAHTCSGARVTMTTSNGAVFFVTNPESPTLQAHLNQYTTYLRGIAHFDAFFQDNAGPLSMYTQYDNFNGMPCGYTDAGWIAGNEALDSSSVFPVIVNGLEAYDNNHGPSIELPVLQNSNTFSGNFEGCYTGFGTLKAATWFWTMTENSELIVNNEHKTFECMARTLTPASSSIDTRIYTYASFLLTYDPQTSIYWSEFSTPSGLHVLPETQLVPTDPLVPSPSSVSALQVSGGAYGREYAHCYLHGSLIGPCAIVVNPDSSSSHPFPYTTYHHSLVLSGSGVLDGGTIAINGAAPPASIPANEAMIVFP